jgi:acyl-CoA synthetase (AMP-forming)/AMP-acid ligase II
LRYSLFCGEPLSAACATAWQDAAPQSVLENLYGPTEATIAISHYRWDRATSPAECLNGIVPIGWLFEAQQARVVDGRGNSAASGENGELCLAGTQVADGYWNDPETSARQFVRLPEDHGHICYRTGDLVKQDRRGCLHYLCRIDQQVKIRGYRVELQEIDLALRTICGTEQAVAVPWPVRDGSAEGVVGFVCGNDRFDELRILRACREVLPEYMVPSKIRCIDELPVNSNGKTDRKRLAQTLEGEAA